MPSQLEPKDFASIGKQTANTVPPKEFRIFRRGWNYTTKGNALFDDLAATMVMAEYRHHGVDGVIDLEHLSVDPESPNYTPDARGWYQLEVRNGELWAINVRWTPDGEKRLNERTQRYISPFFFLGTESRRVTALYNVAICAAPATHDAPALVAASARHGKTIAATNIGDKAMEEFKKMVCGLLGLKDDTSDEDVLTAIKALADEPEGNGGDEPTETSEDPKDEPAKASEEKEEKALSALPPMAQAVLRAKLAKADALDKRLKALESRTNKSEVEALLAANTAKFTKKQEPWLRAQPVEVVREFLAHADPIHDEPKQPPKQEIKAGDAPKTPEQIEAITATDADRAIAKATGMALSEVVKGRKRDAEKRALKLAQ